MLIVDKSTRYSPISGIETIIKDMSSLIFNIFYNNVLLHQRIHIYPLFTFYITVTIMFLD